MKFLTKILLLISCIVVLNGCTEADIRALNNALYGIPYKALLSALISASVHPFSTTIQDIKSNILVRNFMIKLSKFLYSLKWLN